MINLLWDYVYDKMLRASKAIRETFCHQLRLYEPYTTILEDRRERQMHQDTHAAAYWLNLTFQYEPKNHCGDAPIMEGLLSILYNNHITSGKSLVDECSPYRQRSGGLEVCWHLLLAKLRVQVKNIISYVAYLFI